MQDKYQTQLCWRNKLESTHCQFSTSWKCQKAGGYPRRPFSLFSTRRKHLCLLRLLSARRFHVDSTALSSPKPDTGWHPSLLGECYPFTSNSTTHFYSAIKPAWPIESSNWFIAIRSTLWCWLWWSCNFCGESMHIHPTGWWCLGKPLLNWIIGYGVTPLKLFPNTYNKANGMFTWLKVCVEELNISEGLCYNSFSSC